jgi:HEAT repeat protein
MKFWTKNSVVLLMVLCLVGCKPKKPLEPAPKELPKPPVTQKVETPAPVEPAVTEEEQPEPSKPGVAADIEQVTPAEAVPPLKAMLLTGQSANWHPWRVSSPVLKQYLEETGLFTVDVALTPEKGGDMETYRPNFADYDVVVMDYEGDQWSESTQQAFVEYVKSGGGVVFYHAANNNFPKWKEFNEIAGLSGWGNRDEKSGPMVRFRDGKFVLDTTPGKAGEHGPAHPYQMINRVRNHPITRGLPEKWMHAKDELYAKLRGPATNLTILSTAYADPEKGGTGEHEPLLFTVGYGKGRAFNTALGHANELPLTAIECVGFITTFQRGAEWAATGEVTQPVPEDFPTATEVSMRKPTKKANVEELLKKISGYEYGQSRETFTEISDYIRSASNSPKEVEKIEKQLIDFLNSNATRDGKEFICRKLSIIGSAASVDSLASMLLEPATSDMARYALERIPSPAADDALRKALTKTTGKEKVGIINTLGMRGDSKSVEALRKLIDNSNADISAAAIAALGRIGGSDAAGILAEVKNKLDDERLRALALHAYISCADKLVKLGDKPKAFKIYNQAYLPDNPDAIRIAGLRGMVLSGKEDATEIVIDAIKKETGPIQAQAVALVSRIEDPDKIKTVAGHLPALLPVRQLQLLTALSNCAQPGAARPAFITATKSEHQEVRIAALKALAVLDDESTVTLLAEIAASSTGAERRAARESLYSLRGPTVDERIISSISGAEAGVKVELIRSIAQRRINVGAKTLLITAQDSDSQVRLESIKSLRVVNEGNLSELVGVLLNSQSDSERKEAEKIVVAVSNTLGKREGSLPILEGLASTDDVDAACSLLMILGRTGGDGGLEMLRDTLNSDDPKLVDASIRGLSEWPDDEPMDDLLRIAQTSENQTHKVLALRSYIRMIGLDDKREAQETVNLYQGAMNLASDASSKKMILSGLSKVESPAAMKFSADYLDDEELGREAASTVVGIGGNLIENGLGRQCRPILEKVAQTARNKGVREEAQRLIGIIKEMEDKD